MIKLVNQHRLGIGGKVEKPAFVSTKKEIVLDFRFRAKIGIKRHHK